MPELDPRVPEPWWTVPVYWALGSAAASLGVLLWILE